MRAGHGTVGSLLVVLAAVCVSTAQAQGFTVDPKLAAMGKGIFQRKGCAACHNIGKKGRMPGPDLLGVTQRRTVAWLRQIIKTPDQMAVNDSIARSLVREYKTKMPNANLSDPEVAALIHYLASRNAPS